MKPPPPLQVSSEPTKEPVKTFLKNHANELLGKLPLTEDRKRGIKSILNGLALLKTEEFESVKNHRFPKIYVYLTNSTKKAFEISYNNDIEDMYFIIQTNKALGVDKELNLYLEGTKEYFIDLFTDTPNIKVSKIIVQLGEETEKRLFYTDEIGTIWNAGEDCLEYREILREFGIDCGFNCNYEEARKKFKKEILKHHPDKGGDPEKFKKLKTAYDVVIKEKCFQKIKHPFISRDNTSGKPSEKPSGKPSSKPTEKTLGDIHWEKSSKITSFTKIIESQNKKWACNVCMLDNNNDVNKCIACGSKKE